MFKKCGGPSATALLFLYYFFLLWFLRLFFHVSAFCHNK